MTSWTKARVEALLTRQRRVILGITGPPGAGKTRLAESVASSFDDAVPLPMDGFHLADAELERLRVRDRKGAIDSFDAHGYLALLQRIRDQSDEIVYAPAFDRDIEQPIAGSIPVAPETRLIVTEGNYLLDDEPPWPSVLELLSEVWFIDVPRDRKSVV
jgi:pantothenate kinase